jgi:hypothetical protein
MEIAPPSLNTAVYHSGADISPEDFAELSRRVRTLPPALKDEFFEGFIGSPDMADSKFYVREKPDVEPKYQERDDDIRKLRADGWTYGQLHIRFGLSRTRLHQIVQAGAVESVQGAEGLTVDVMAQ